MDTMVSNKFYEERGPSQKAMDWLKEFVKIPGRAFVYFRVPSCPKLVRATIEEKDDDAHTKTKNWYQLSSWKVFVHCLWEMKVFSGRDGVLQRICKFLWEHLFLSFFSSSFLSLLKGWLRRFCANHVWVFSSLCNDILRTDLSLSFKNTFEL